MLKPLAGSDSMVAEMTQSTKELEISFLVPLMEVLEISVS